MARPKKKTSGDYPLYSFRMKNEETKLELDKKVDAALAFVNKGFTKHDRKHTKSELLKKAIEIGLREIKAGREKLGIE